MKSVLAFGDSNTWGLVPGTGSRVRYPENIRWTGLLQSRLNDTRVIEEGLCGRTTVFEDELRGGRKGLSPLANLFGTSLSVCMFFSAGVIEK